MDKCMPLDDRWEALLFENHWRIIEQAERWEILQWISHLESILVWGEDKYQLTVRWWHGRVMRSRHLTMFSDRFQGDELFEYCNANRLTTRWNGLDRSLLLVCIEREREYNYLFASNQYAEGSSLFIRHSLTDVGVNTKDVSTLMRGAHTTLILEANIDLALNQTVKDIADHLRSTRHHGIDLFADNLRFNTSAFLSGLSPTQTGQCSIR